MPDLQAVIFDLGRVLVGVDVSRGLWRRLLSTLEGQASDTPAGSAWREIYDRFATGRMPPKEFHDHVCRLLDEQIAYPDFVNKWCDVFHDLAGARGTLAALSGRVPIGLLSDTDPLHWRHVAEHYQWLAAIERPTLSFEIGVLKPDRRAYLAAAGNVGVEPANCLFIDDLDQNVTGAREAGMQGMLFVGHAELQAELERIGLLGA